MFFSIVIPIYNEEFNINLLVDEIYNSLNNFNSKFEIILVDDSSEDKSLQIINELSKQNPKIIKVVKNNKNLGQSLSLLKGIEYSSYQTIITIDGDGQNNPKDIPFLLDKFFSDKRISLVGGIRKKRKDSIVKIISSKLANYIRRKILDDDCVDTGCSLKVFDKGVFMNFPFFNGMHRFLPALFKGYGSKTFFINVDHRHRRYGYSKYGTFGRLFNGVKDLIKVVKIIKQFKRNHA